LAGGLASAQGVVEYRTQRFRELDANHDGRITPAELNDHPGNFRALDRDGDGLISFDEYLNRSGPAPAPAPVVVPPPVEPTAPVDTFAALDRNDNGVISRGEWRGDAQTFARMDRNDDNRITRDEYLNPLAADTRYNTFLGYDVNRDGWLSRREWRGQSWAFDDVDRNGDGRISRAEYLNMGTANTFGRFRDLDYDGNGVLTLNEWQGIRSDFNRLDQNGDRRLSAWEFQQNPLVRPVGRASFTTYDRNRDGYIQDYEWTGSRRDFDRLDRNGDGRLSRWEYSM